jgi:hypothetical protein
MHESILEQARRRDDVCGVRLYVERKNDVAKTTYARVGLRASTYHVFEDDFVMKKE